MVRHGNEQIRLLDARLHLDTVTGAVAHHALNIHGVHRRLQPLPIRVDHRDGVPLLPQLFGHGKPHLAAAHNNDVHMYPLFSQEKSPGAEAHSGPRVFYFLNRRKTPESSGSFSSSAARK